jgi:uncharacterized protein (DUF433 family)
MDAMTASQSAEEAASGAVVNEQPIAYPHLWFDNRGRPWIDDTNVKVIEVVCDYTGWCSTAEEMHEQYPHLSLAQIHSALAYYYDHKQEFDEEIARQVQRVDELAAKANAESPFIQRMRALGKLA